ncbi:hypothetical protein [Prauserella cavernicola]|uniref:Plasmid replication, integration and excision activator n=1 Tax=Prauserella cavernicola TaxID=2800127 RepID=A0A934QTU2_9PSEU|nr:hypothetical protein [Prauserella cavernicola]MBK1785234.1 hypothetical protein [Prauserella cavernicola]
MAINRGHRFPINFDDAFPQGLVMVGEVAPDNEYLSNDERARGKQPKQKLDETTGKRQWKATVTDPSETNAKRASFVLTFLADVQPVPTTDEALPGMRPIELDGLTAEPKVAGNGEFKYQSYVFRATAFKAAMASGGAGRSAGKSAGNGGGAETPAKAA